MSHSKLQLDDERQILQTVSRHGLWARVRVYLKLAGPGWLQSALMLGGGSLAGSLYLGVLSGFSLLWLQPLAMVLTVFMFSALGYVTLSTGRRPFHAINHFINPVLGWGWALASLVGCMVWAMPQYALAAGVLQQNLFPEFLGPEGPLTDLGAKLLISLSILALLTAITWSYGRGGPGIRVFEWIVKSMVALIVICFVGVVLRLGIAPQGLNWSAIWSGYLPDFSLFFRPADTFAPLLEALSDDARRYWSDVIVTRQRDVMVAVVAAAAGVNATFLFAYSILGRNWGKEHRGFLMFDLSVGMLVPFAIATSCVVIAAAAQFHTVAQPGFLLSSSVAYEELNPGQVREFQALLRGRVLQDLSPSAGLSDAEMSRHLEQLGPADRRMAATLLTRDAFDLAASLRPLTGDFFARIIFSFGVLGMTLSSITLHMLISGMVICELLGLPHRGWPLRLGSLAAATGMLGPFLWNQAAFWLAIPTSVFNFVLIPIAYLTFLLMLNHRGLLGPELPIGWRKLAWNVPIGLVVILFSLISAYTIWDKSGVPGTTAAILFILAALAAHIVRRKRNSNS